MYFSIGVLCLSIAALIGFHLGSHAAQAQAQDGVPGYRVTMVNAGSSFHYVMLANGDVYMRQHDAYRNSWSSDLVSVGNFWSSPVATSQSTIGGVKAKYR